MFGVIIEISFSFYTLDLVIVAFLLSRDFPLFQGLALTFPAILAADVNNWCISRHFCTLGKGRSQSGGTEELLMEETDAFYRFILPKGRIFFLKMGAFCAVILSYIECDH